jgi:DNA primase
VACDGDDGSRLIGYIDNHIRDMDMAQVHSIQWIKATITVDHVLAYYGATPLRRIAKGRAGPCPICCAGKNKKSRRFTVSEDGRAWYCFGACKRGGTVVDFVIAHEACTPGEAVRQLSEMCRLRSGTNSSKRYRKE